MDSVATGTLVSSHATGDVTWLYLLVCHGKGH